MKKFSELFTEAGQPFTGYRPRPANDAAALGAAPHAMGEKEFMDLHQIQKAPYLNDSQEKIFNGAIDQPFSTPGHEGNDRGKGNPPKSGKLAEKGERDDKPTQGTDAAAKVMGKLFGSKNRNTSNLTGNKLGEEVELDEGKLKAAAEKDAEKLSKAQFSKKYGKDVVKLFYEDEEEENEAVIKLKGFGKDAGKSNMSNPAARAALTKSKSKKYAKYDNKRYSKRYNEEESVIQEAILDTLKKIVKDKSAQKVKFKNGKTLTVDMQTANLLVKVVGALKPANQKKFADTMEKGPSAFMKMVDFAYSATK